MDGVVAWLQDGQMESTPRPVLPGHVGPARPGQRGRRWDADGVPPARPPPPPRSIQITGVWWAAAAVVLARCEDQLRAGQTHPGRGGDRVGRRGGAVAGRAAPSRADRPHGGDRRLHRIARHGWGAALGDRDRVTGVAALPPPGRVRRLLPGGLAGGPLATVDRPRPFGVELRGSWAGWAMPLWLVAIVTATLIGILYTLLPVGRWRQLGSGSRPPWSQRSLWPDPPWR